MVIPGCLFAPQFIFCMEKNKLMSVFYTYETGIMKKEKGNEEYCQNLSNI